MEEKREEFRQVSAKEPVRIPAKAFEETDSTKIYWLGNGGAFINARGTCLMIDPLLEGFDMPLLVDAPVTPEETGMLSVVLITHCDNDHLSRVTCRKLADRCGSFHGPHYVAKLLEAEGISAAGHDIHESFVAGGVQVTLTPADHAWQNESKKHATRHFRAEDYCGYQLDTPDGRIWMPGDSRLLEEQLHMPEPDVILLDFSDSRWHIGFEGAVTLCDTYPEALLIPIHWGCVNAPAMPEFNGDPERLRSRITNPGRLLVLAPGEACEMRGRQLWES